MTQFKEDTDEFQKGAGVGIIWPYLRLLRPRQWAKNLLVFVAPVMAHRISDWEAMGTAGLAFVSFSLCASSGYIFNDILDRTADRQHPVKSQRPVASGRKCSGFATGRVSFEKQRPTEWCPIPALFAHNRPKAFHRCAEARMRLFLREVGWTP